MEPEFGDDTPEDAVSEGDEEVNWDQVEELAEQIEAIQFIGDDQERLKAAEQWVTELNGAT
jgi:hypothetical protein